MRDIKFRAKSLNGELIYYTIYDIGTVYLADGVFYVFGEPCQIGTEQQYIGQKIKGEEIYEGDILKRGDSVGEVYYNESLAQFVIDGAWGERQTDKAMRITPLNVKLGNKFENPELLKV